MNLTPVILKGKLVSLVPLNLEYTADLVQAAQDESIWKYMRYGPVTTPDAMAAFIQDLLALQALGTDLPFTVVHPETGRAIGMTRYMAIEPHNRALEIGGTWYGVAYQHTGVNTECKFLLLQYAFEKLDCVRVQLKTDLRNVRSQRAIERIGAKREGVLRDHMILPDGALRSSVYYSILAAEWPEVRQHLAGIMAGY